VIKVVSYTRVSTDAQAEQGFGLDVQRDQIRAWSRDAGVKVAARRSDEGVSGTKELEHRPGLAEALDLIRSGTVVGLVVARLDRLARDLILQEQLLAEVRRLGGQAFSCSKGEQGYLADDPADPSRKLIRQVLGAVSEYERNMITLRLASGRARKAADGGYAYGAPPFGWQSDAGRLVPNPDESAVLARMAELRERGQSLRQIAYQLEIEGHRPKRGGQWHPSTVARALSRT